MKKALHTIAIVLLICAIGFVPDAHPDAEIHQCSYPLCPFKGDIQFTALHSDCEEGTDCYYLDSLHFAYPDKDYDYIDSLLFAQPVILIK